MSGLLPQLVIFSDLDGCLLNKTDYAWSAAEPALQQLLQRRVPVVLSSSKTTAEMSTLIRELPLLEAPLIAENGGSIVWPESFPALSGPTVAASNQLSVNRSTIVGVLASLKPQFRFRSFVDLGVEGVMAATELPRRKAELACQRQSTEPLLWDDAEERLPAFREQLAARNLTLTKGGRFWHVAGKLTKGSAMQLVAEQYRQMTQRNVTTVAIGDSPNDQSMLDIADYPIGIPTAVGRLDVNVDRTRGIVASTHGAAGWGEAVMQLLERIV